MVGKDGKKCRITKIQCSESLHTTLVGKDQEKCEMTKIGNSESFWTTLVGKDWKMHRTAKIGKSVKWPKLGILNYFGLLWWEKCEKSLNWSF